MNLLQIHRVYRGWTRGLEYGTRREVERLSFISLEARYASLSGHGTLCALRIMCFLLLTHLEPDFF